MAVNTPNVIRQQASIVAVDGENVTVECITQSACAQCSQQDNCGNGSIAKAFPKRSTQIVIQQSGQYQTGQQVELLLPAKALLQSAALVYFVPLLALVVGAFAGEKIAANFDLGEWVSVLLALVCALLSGLLIRHFGDRNTVQPKLDG
ncbi:transcriptional regulator [Alginatibacterium sediminis]|uniref:Transcriptional regulator n=1 Tax=Alginatibacterium sediminis TaxID=2164068 RepID=A0A420ED57_9ALTE|nr:SoxR reducing system RseC family protein [Alginatibacterium sediminis]RKF18603.1 transcriptional regulator [Alginatibacterium sediminis]